MAYVRSAVGLCALLLIGCGIYLEGRFAGRDDLLSSIRIVVDRSPTRHVFYRCDPIRGLPGYEACAIDTHEQN